jgi:DNA-binding NtrC family response regulator
MENRILFVDDDSNILDAFKRQLRNQFHIETAEGSKKGLEVIQNNDPFAVIVSDLKMPGMDGNQFLTRVKEISPESTRILLTGYADLSSAIKAINDGNIFRLLTKPCDKKVLIQALNNGIEEYKKTARSITEEKVSDALPKKKILIVDDDPVTIKLLHKTLNDIEDLDVYTAKDGKKAIDLLNKKNIDLLISDLHMPGINGLQLLHHVSKHFPGIRVIILTGCGTSNIENKIKSIGSYQYYEKPLDINVFKEAALRELQATPAGQIHGINISSFLQLIDIEGKICTLTVRSQGKVGYLYFRDGELIAAETNGQKGEKAAQKIINWDDSVIEITDICKKNKREILKPLMQILMESARIKDEGSIEVEN